MVRAKNYETTSKFVKVMPRILWLRFPDTVYIRLLYFSCNVCLPNIMKTGWQQTKLLQ